MATTASPSTSFRLLSECPLPTEDGDVMLRIYGDGTCSPWPVCVFGEVHGKSAVSVRLHDACMTSEVLASVKCDCARQLRLAQRQLAASGGVLVCSRVHDGLALRHWAFGHWALGIGHWALGTSGLASSAASCSAVRAVPHL